MSGARSNVKPGLAYPWAMNLHSGTVTFLFSDVEGSTELLKRLGESAYANALGQHRRILREAFTARGGREIDSQGDAFFYAFARARDAVGAAVEAQRALAGHAWPDDVDIRVRMGLHTGEPVVGDEGYTGLDVVRAARIAAVGRGGQVLLSETTRALIGPELPDGITARPLGEQRLKDIDRPEPLHELVIEGVPGSGAAIEPEPDEEPDLDSFGKQMSRMIQAKVLRELRRSLDDESR
jgi:class 3 adenylate cyclase